MTETLMLSRKQVAELLAVEECMVAVEAAFKMLADGKAGAPKVLGIQAENGGLHIKAGMLNLKNNYIVAKMNSNFPGNPQERNLPTIQGAIAVFNADNGALLAVMDSIEITIVRTGAATGIAAKYLARRDSTAMTICGCGNQGLISLNAIAVNFDLTKVYLYDINPAQVEKLSNVISSTRTSMEVSRVQDLKAALKKSDIVVTCTPSKSAIIHAGDVAPGTFIAAVGADNDDKNEIHPELISKSKLVVDLAEQCAAFGDLHHAIRQGYIGRDHIHAELSEVIGGKKHGRENEHEIIVFDSTGMALQDVAAAAIVYEKALATQIGSRFNFQQ
jgi:alanine dehydrogenase